MLDTAWCSLILLESAWDNLKLLKSLPSHSRYLNVWDALSDLMPHDTTWKHLRTIKHCQVASSIFNQKMSFPDAGPRVFNTSWCHGILANIGQNLLPSEQILDQKWPLPDVFQTKWSNLWEMPDVQSVRTKFWGSNVGPNKAHRWATGGSLRSSRLSLFAVI